MAGGCWCVCAGDWIGATCNTSLDTHLEYLPGVLPALSDERDALSASFLNGSQELLRELSRVHAPANCRRDRALVFDYNDQGLAAVVSDAAVQLTWALAQGKAAVFRGPWMYGEHAGCRHAPGVGCHLHPHFACEAGGAGLRDFSRSARQPSALGM